MKLTVRADGGTDIGYGHLMRTCSVTHALRNLVDLEVRYLVRPHTDTSILREGSIVRETTRDDSWITEFDPDEGPLLLDTYETTVEHLAELRSRGIHVVMFDDGCRLDHYPVDLLIDSAPAAHKLSYHGEIGTLFALGVDYLPLRDQFHKVDRKAKPSHEGINLLLTFGGSDPEDLTTRVLRIVERMSELDRITVVLGPGYRGGVSSADAGGRIVVLRNVTHMAELMQQANIAISTAGGTALELAYMGIPSLLIPQTTDQKPIAEALADKGAALVTHFDPTTGESHLQNQLLMLAQETELRGEMTAAGRHLVDGRGSERIAKLLLDGWKGRLRVR